MYTISGSGCRQALCSWIKTILGCNLEFSPLDIAGCVLWLDASAITGLANNDPVASWSDLSGNARHATQTTEAKKPIYMTNQQNGLPGVDFDRTNHGMLVDFSTGVSAQDYTFIFATKTETTNVNADQRLFDFQSGRFIVSSVTATVGWVGWITLPEGWTNAVAATNAVQILSFVFDDAGASVFRDGASIATGKAWAQKALGGTVGMGREYDMTQYGFDGQLYEVVVYTGALSSANRGLVETYLSDKWGIALA